MGLGLGLGLDKPKGLIYFQNQFSMKFDGINDKIITDGADTVAQPTTYSFWCKSSTTGINKGVFGHGSDRAGAFHFHWTSSRPLLFLGTNYLVFWNDTSAQDDGEWHHWVVYSDTNNVANSKLYIDGVLQTVNQVVSSGSASYTESLTIGCDQAAAGGNFFEGSIDEFAVFDRELTQAEITRMYNTYYTNNLVKNGNFEEIGSEEVTNGDFSQIGSEIVSNSDMESGFTNGVANNYTVSGGIPSQETSIYVSANNSQKISTSSSTAIFSHNNITVVSGTLFKASCFVRSDVSQSVRFSDYNGSGEQITQTIPANTWVNLIFYITKGNTTFIPRVQTLTSQTGYLLIDNVSVKEVGQGWTFGAGWNMGDGVALNSGSGANSWLYQSKSYSAGKTYKISADVNLTSGSVRLGFNSVLGDFITTTGSATYTYYLTLGSNQTFAGAKTGGSFSGSIDNISIKEVGQGWTFGSAWSTDGTKAIYDDSAINSITQTLSLFSSKTYKIQFKISNSSGSGARMKFGNSPDSVVFFDYAYYTDGEHTLNYNATSNSTDFNIKAHTDGSSFDIDNIVVQELKHDATNLMLNAGAYQSANPLITSTKSMEFDGSDDYLQLSEPFSYTNHTVTAWVNLGTTGLSQEIFSAADSNTDGIRLLAISTGQIRYKLNAENIESTSNAEVGKWVLVTATYDGTTAKLYIDGVLNNSLTTSQTISTTPNVTLGKKSFADSLYFEGKITEVGAYNRALTSLEVASLYNQGVPTDLLVNRNNYQSGNPTLFNTKQVDFDGTDDYLYLGSQSATSSLTYSAWVYCEGNNSNIFSYGKTIFRCSNTTELKYWSDITQSNITLTVDDYFNKWTHFVVTQTGTTYAIYQNGIQKSTGTVAAISTTQDNSYIGRFSTQYFNGKISQVGIFNEALTADEVSSLYNHGLPIDLMTDQAAYESSSNLVGYWRMGSGTNDGFPIISDQLSPSLAHISTTNLILYSQDISNAAWTKSSGGTGSTPVVTANYTASPLEGEMADRVIFNLNGGTASADLSTLQSSSFNLTLGDDVTYYMAVKTNDGSTVNMTLNNNLGLSEVKSITPEWTIIKTSTTVTSTSSGVLRLRLRGSEAVSDYADVSVSYAQLEEHPIATPYVKSNGVPGQRKSSTTNLVTYSEDTSQWTDSGITYSVDYIISPGGTLNASKAIINDTITSSNTRPMTSVAVTSGKNYVFSVFGKADEFDMINLDFSNTAFGSVSVDYNLTNGTVTSFVSSPVSQGVEDYGNGWYRCYVVATAIATTNTALIIRLDDNPTGDGTSGLYLWGAQLEEQTQVTPYIKTIGSPVTVEFYKENNYAEMVNLMGGADFSDGIKNGSPYANTVQYPNDFSQYSTGGAGVTLTTGQLAPDGTLTATKVSGVVGSSSLFRGGDSSTTASRSIYARTVSGTGTASLMSYHSNTNNTFTITEEWQRFELTGSIATGGANFYAIDFRDNSTTLSELIIWGANSQEPNTGLQGYWKMGDGINDEYSVIYDQTNPTLGSELVTGFTNGDTYPFTTFTTSGNNITSAIISSAFAGAVTNAISIVAGQVYKVTFDYNKNSGDDLRIVFTNSLSGAGSQASAYEFISESGSYIKYFTITSTFSSGYFQMGTGASGDSLNASITNVSIKLVNGNPATMTHMPEGNITNQYPLTKLRNYYRMGDGILDSKFLSYPTDPLTDAPYIFQDQTSPNLAHIPTTNFFAHSNDFSVWARTNLTISPNEIISPDGTLNGAKITDNSTDSAHRMIYGFTTPSSGTFTYSVFLKKGTLTTAQIQVFNDGTASSANINLLNGTITDGGQGINHTIENYGNDWYRCSISGDLSLTATTIYVYAKQKPSYIGNGDYLYVWGVQLEVQSQATAYLPSYGVASVRKSSTTNLVEYSEDLSKSEWVKASMNFVSNIATSPDGTLNATSLTNTTTGQCHARTSFVTATTGIYTGSAYLKKQDFDFVYVEFGNAYAWFNISNGTLGSTGNFGSGWTFVSHSIESVGNDWYRVSITANNTTTGTYNFRPYQPTSSNGSYNSGSIGTSFIWGTQVEQQTQAETYAKTKGIPVTIDLFTENNYGHTQGGVIQKDVPRNS